MIAHLNKYWHVWACVSVYIYIYINIYQEQDIYYSRSYISISSKPSKDWVFKGLEETEI